MKVDAEIYYWWKNEKKRDTAKDIMRRFMLLDAKDKHNQKDIDLNLMNLITGKYKITA